MKRGSSTSSATSASRLPASLSFRNFSTVPVSGSTSTTAECMPEANVERGGASVTERVRAEAAATVRTNMAKIWPTRSFRAQEKATRLMLTASSMSSTDIRMMMTFFRFRKMPKMPIVNRIAATVR